MPATQSRSRAVASVVLLGAMLMAATAGAANLVPNPLLELDFDRDGIPDFWNRGGSDPASCAWDTVAFSSAKHSLLITDLAPAAYGEWYSDFIGVSPTNRYQVGFKRRYATPGVMRLSVNLHDASDAFIATATFSVHGTNQTWTETSLDLPIPSNVRKLRFSLASGGSLSETGRIAIDDLFLTPSPRPALPAGTLRAVEAMPALPSPWALRDWPSVARAYDRFVFDTQSQGQFLPLIRIEASRPNFTGDAMWLPSYVGSATHGGEGINSMAAVLGASLVDIDKSSQAGRNWVLMQNQFYNDANGERLVLNLPNTTSGQTFWYEIYPHILFYALVGRYPETARIEVPFSRHPGSASMESIMRITAERWRDAAFVMGGKTNQADFNWTAFRFSNMQPVYNGQWREPDAAAGIAWLEFMAYVKFGDPKFLEAARWGMDALERSSSSPLYENLLPFGALLAARMNAELGSTYNVQKLLDGCFDANGTARYGLGVMKGSWGDREVNGLAGMVTEVGGYAFAMNTFSMAGALAPVARYDTRFAPSLGRWLLNLANNARLFYPDAFPASQQSSAFWTGDPGHVIPYEGLRREWDGQIPYASGDPIFYQWGPRTDLALYGGSHVGFLAAMQKPTSNPRIIAWDLLATDHFHAAALPTFLCGNPESSSQSFRLEGIAPPGSLIYEATRGTFLPTDTLGSLTLAPTNTWVLVVCPAAPALSADGDKLLCNGAVVDYRWGSRDSDSDSLPDWWESRYFGNAVDADPLSRAANGYTLDECHRLGLNPLDAGSTFRILGAVLQDDGSVEIQWSTIGGRSDVIEVADGLQPGSLDFQSLGSYREKLVVAGAEGVGRFVDTSGGGAGHGRRLRIYRIRAGL